MKKDADIKCEYCGAILELEKAVRFEPDSGEYKYVCTSCAIMWNGPKKGLGKTTIPISLDVVKSSAFVA